VKEKFAETEKKRIKKLQIVSLATVSKEIEVRTLNNRIEFPEDSSTLRCSHFSLSKVFLF
jgi:hypothetical protein